MMLRVGLRRRKRPAIHEARPSRNAREFADCFFDPGAMRAAAVRVHKRLEGFSGLDLSGLQPDDLIGDLIPPPDSLDAVETLMDLEESDAARKRPIIEAPIEEYFWARVLREVLGSSASLCTWSPATLPQRTVSAVVQQLAKLSVSNPNSDVT